MSTLGLKPLGEQMSEKGVIGDDAGNNIRDTDAIPLSGIVSVSISGVLNKFSCDHFPWGKIDSKSPPLFLISSTYFQKESIK